MQKSGVAYYYIQKDLANHIMDNIIKGMESY